MRKIILIALPALHLLIYSHKIILAIRIACHHNLNKIYHKELVSFVIHLAKLVMRKIILIALPALHLLIYNRRIILAIQIVCYHNLNKIYHKELVRFVIHLAKLVMKKIILIALPALHLLIYNQKIILVI
jgi:hypothetical protein